MDKKNEKIVSRSEDFAKWYTSIIQEAKLIQYYDVKGFMIFQPYGWEIWENIKFELDKKLKKEGSKNLYVPLLIPYSEFEKEKEHVKGFNPELFTITKIGNKELDEKLVIRPTSEILFCKYWKNILTSYKDLPFKHNQWTSVYRAEKTTKPFLRNSEFHWHELHCLFSKQNEAKEFTKRILDVYSDFITNVLCIPNIKGEKTPGERFAGAENTYTIETVMQDNHALQSATSHYLGKNFTKAYQINYQTKDNKLDIPFSTSHGLSTRIIGAIIMVHSDDNGLVLPWDIAPTQISLCPLFISKNKDTLNKSNEILEALSDKYRIELDNSDKTLGFLIADKQVKGVPFTLIIGPRDLEKNQVMIFRRDTNTKEFIQFNELEKWLQDNIEIYKRNLFTKAKSYLDNVIVDVNSFDELKEVINNNKWARCYFDGEISDEEEIKELTKATPRCFQIVENSGQCIKTNKNTNKLTIFAKNY